MSPDISTDTAKAAASSVTTTTTATTTTTKMKARPSTTASDRTDYFTRHLTPPDLSHLRDNLVPQLDPKTAKVVWRDFLFVCLGAVAVSMIGFVESNASNAEARSLAVRIAGMITFGLDNHNNNGDGLGGDESCEASSPAVSRHRRHRMALSGGVLRSCRGIA